MDVNKLETKICRFFDENIIDDKCFSILALSVAKLAVGNIGRIETLKEWAKTIIRQSNGNDSKNFVSLKKHIGKIAEDDSVESALVYLSNGDSSTFFKRGENDEISVNLSEIVSADKKEFVFSALFVIMEEILVNHPQLFANFNETMKSIKDDIIESGGKIPKPQEREYKDYDIDVSISI